MRRDKHPTGQSPNSEEISPMSSRHVHASMTLRVLGYQDKAEWAAHCLETDLVGRGKNFTAALHDLLVLTEMQVSFALQSEQPSLLNHPAPPDIWQMYEQMAQEQLRNLNKPSRGATRALGALPLPEGTGSRGRLAWCGA